ncbi:MAG: hypothetical protein IKF83_00160 [Clostridia bacterium]|nr:hypothetical protein [Clostridia bacterium]
MKKISFFDCFIALIFAVIGTATLYGGGLVLFEVLKIISYAPLLAIFLLFGVLGICVLGILFFKIAYEVLVN